MYPSGKYHIFNDIHPEFMAHRYYAGVYFFKSQNNKEKTQ